MVSTVGPAQVLVAVAADQGPHAATIWWLDRSTIRQVPPQAISVTSRRARRMAVTVAMVHAVRTELPSVGARQRSVPCSEETGSAALLTRATPEQTGVVVAVVVPAAARTARHAKPERTSLAVTAAAAA